LIRNVAIHQDWVVHVTTDATAQPFSQPQLELLKQHFGADADLVQRIIRSQLESLQAQRFISLQIPPVTIFVYSDTGSSVVAVTSHESQTTKTGDESHQIEDMVFLTASEKMKAILEIIAKVSYVDSTVLLLGPSGVGKSKIARLIHKYSSRSDKSFISVNCGSIPEPLMEAELFGYTSGSFTGARKGGKKGIFESADGGTVFLDEVAELPFNLQVKLLEVLQENYIRPVGGTKVIPVNTRVIAATNQNLFELVKRKQFREDLYYRLNVVPIEIPSLRERPEDILPLAHHFLKQRIKKYGIEKTFSPEVEAAFQQYDWPGNVRELENMVERLYITTDDRVIQWEHLPPSMFSVAKVPNVQAGHALVPLKDAKRALEEELIKKAYALYKSTYKVAEVLQVDQSTVAKKLKEYRKRGLEIQI
jgi:transcriptional regulator with PAS, ATPase and Fis domain